MFFYFTGSQGERGAKSYHSNLRNVLNVATIKANNRLESLERDNTKLRRLLPEPPPSDKNKLLEAIFLSQYGKVVIHTAKFINHCFTKRRQQPP